MKVSVCLASYNGERYIAQQLASILADLAPDDEVVVSDDASTDRTLDIVRSFDDRRIRLHAFSENVRHVKNFERAMALATGDVIFLSDQDDIWLAGKRAAVMAVFEARPGVSMVVHALALIDDEGRQIAPRSDVWPAAAEGVRPSRRYLLRQLLKSQITGCALAFRRDLLSLLLPFPKTVYAHDHWISVVAPAAGDVYFLNRVLLLYRQHAANVTPKGGLSLRRRLAVRATLASLMVSARNRAARRSAQMLN